jgi:hypothetical protein
MGLITETNAQYYSGQHIIQVPAIATNTFTFAGYDTDLVSAFDSALTHTSPNSNFNLYYIAPAPGSLPVLIPENEIYIENPIGKADIVTTLNNYVSGLMLCQLKQFAIAGNYGSYSYLSLNDIVDNFLVAYVGEDKIIQHVKRSDVLFHARRGMQEFSYDTLPVIQSQELTIPPSLSVPIPQDYVNYVRVAYADSAGVLHTIMPAGPLTGDPYKLPLQDSQGIPTQDSFEENLYAQQSQIEENWKNMNPQTITGNYNLNDSMGVYDWVWWKQAYGKRYGLNPETATENGWFTINEREGKFSFSSNLGGLTIMLNYISDGLADNFDARVPKFIEEAMYMHLMYSILSTRLNVPPNLVQRFKKDKYVTLRNAKIRLSNIKLDEIVQVFRGKSKWIKH